MEYYIEKKSYDGRGRKPKKRILDHTPLSTIWKKYGNSLNNEIVTLGFDEIEALRLKYIENMYIIQACKSMGISKSLFANIVNKALYKLVLGIIDGKDIEIKKRVAPLDYFSEPVV